MASDWSAENATKAYLRTLKMGKRGKEPDVSEFISAMAAGNNAQLMVMVCSTAGSTTILPLVVAARQTGGRVVCILPCFDSSAASKKAAFGAYAAFVVGDATTLLQNDYKGADFVLIDCNIFNHEGIFRAAQEEVAKCRGKGVVIGFNSFSKELLSSNEFKAHFLPIGEGLLVTRLGGCGAPAAGNRIGRGFGGSRKRSRWIVKVDKWTGEEHVFRINTSHIKT